MKATRLVLLLLPLTLPVAASAQMMNPNAQAAARIDRLERDVMLLQRQLAQGGVPASTITADPESGGAQLEVRLSAIEEALRDLRGRTEQNEFQMRKLSETLEKMQRDTEFRFGQLEGAPAPSPAPAFSESSSPVPSPLTEAPTGPTSAGDGVLRLPENNPGSEPSSPREHYNYAFRLLNQTQYEAAGQAFDAFTKQYPKDPLVGNAYYWKGETHYIRRDYVNAADSFRQGFEALPEGPKAADNLLKLAMSLNALARDKEACIVLQQVVTKFRKSSTTVTDKAMQEQKRIGCQS